jgi:hypothetical protein
VPKAAALVSCPRSAPALVTRQQVTHSLPASAAPKAMPARGLERRPPENGEYHDTRGLLARGALGRLPQLPRPGPRAARAASGLPGRPAPGQHEHQQR